MYSKFDANDTDVIIIGAGLSGLTAAYYILKKEPTLNIIILEGNNRIGGRILTEDVQLKDDTIHCDLGGQYFSTHQTPLMNLLSELKIDFDVSKGSSGYLLGVFWDTIKKSSSRPPKFGNFIVNYELEIFFSDLEQLSKKIQFHIINDDNDNVNYDNITMEQYIENKLYYNINKAYIKIFIKTIYGVDTNSISVLFYCACCHSNFGFINQNYMSKNHKRCYIIGGAYKICERLIEKIGRRNIYLNEKVIKVRHLDDYVLVKTHLGYYKSDFVIVTIPPNEIIDVEFHPALPREKCNYLTRMTRGKSIKFYVMYDEPFWKRSNLSGDILIHNPHSPIVSCFHIDANQYHVIYGFVNPNYDNGNEESYKWAVLNELKKYFGEEALDSLAYIEKDWSMEIGTGGCSISVPGINTTKHSIRVAEHIGRIYWSGTETSKYFYGNMAGAVYSGYKAAIEILYSIRPQAVTIEDWTVLDPMPYWFRYYKTPGIKRYLTVKCLVPVALLGLMLVLYVGKILRNN